MIDKRKWMWLAVAVVVVIIGVSVVVVKSRDGVDAAETVKASVEIEAVASKTVEGIQILSAPIDVKDSGLFPANGYLDLQKEMAGVKPAVQAYSVEPDLSNVANLKMFKSLLQPEDRKMLADNLFVVIPTDYDQMFYVYENNEYQRPEKIPSFITTDSMLHTYHVFYDYSLREIETGPLFDALVKLTEGMIRASQNDYNNAREESVKEAAKRNIAFFAVARQLLNDTPSPDIAASMVKADLASINKHAGRGECKCVGAPIDFTQFIPRGHYTRSDKLKRYFKAMMWYGLTAFMAEGSEAKMPTLESFMMVRNLRTVKYQGKVLYEYWNIIYEPTVFYVGKADDLTVYDYARLSDSIFGKAASADSFADDSKAAVLRSEIAKLPKPKIAGYPVGKQYRFMGQRCIPDSRVTQKIGDALWPDNPSGLDVLAAMGSDRALQIRRDSGLGDGYSSVLAEMRIELEHTPLHTWQSNLYWGWLWSLKSIIEPAPQGYPSFMRNQAWVDKSLFTALGSWSELRHDTILYAKQSVSECGGSEEGEEEEVPQPKGYVEPNLEFWIKLKWLNEYTRQGLERRGLLSEELKDKFETIGDMIEFCRRVSVKELTNQKLTRQEYDQICMYGPELEHLTLSFQGEGIVSETDNDMAVIADVHTNGGSCLEEGVGRAAAVYVVVPIEGKLYITRGSVFTHYEFDWPASDRLTDEKWQKMLNEGEEPAFAPWTKSFLINTKREMEQQFSRDDGGC